MTSPAEVISPGNSGLACAYMESSPSENSSETISLSTSFFPGANVGQGTTPTDVTLCSSDTVFFYVHSTVLTSISSNGFNGLLADERWQSQMQRPTTISSPPLTPSSVTSAQLSPNGDYIFPDDRGHRSPMTETIPLIIAVPDHSPILNIALHLIYKLPCGKYNPDLPTISQVFPFLIKCGIDPSDLIQPLSEIPRLLLLYAPVNPIEVYTIASANHFDALATLSSQYTLTAPLWSISDDQASSMGPIYFKRLVFLHLGRGEALKRVISAPPKYHFPTASCSMDSQRGVTRAWSLAGAFVLQGGQGCQNQIQGITVATLDSIFSPLVSSTSCSECKTCLRTRIASMLQDWSLVKNTI